MANNDVYSRISEKMRNEQFTEEEIKTVEKAKNQLSSYATGGSVVGGGAGLLLAKAKNFKGIQAMAIATGGFLIGSQIGLVMGAMSSLRTIQSIPNFQRVMHIVQEVRDETSGPGGAPRHDRTASFPSAGHGRFPVQHRTTSTGGASELVSDEHVAELQPGHHFQGFQDGDGYHGGHDPSGAHRPEGSQSWANVEQRARELQSNASSWTQIRQQNMSKSSWNKIREGKMDKEEEDSEAENGDSTKAAMTTTTTTGARRMSRPGQTSWDRLRDNSDSGFVTVSGSSTAPAPDGPSEFPRTREDLQSMPVHKKNQYGDAL
ncbi:hypothetical protein BGZ94_001158 [Podila epigama]|nr:hypothetical protein BGZ94_001158 [Podila epigama]